MSTLESLSRDRLRAIYYSGATSVTIDGHAIAVDRKDVARILGELDQKDPLRIANREVRPGFFVDIKTPFE